MADPAEVETQNILPVQALFNVDNTFNTFIGQGQPFIVSATDSIGIQDVTALNATLYPTLSPVSTGQVTTLDVTSTKLTFNPSTGVLSSTTFAGFLSGTASAANNIANGTSGQIPYQTSANNTGFITNGVLGQVLTSNGSGAPTWSNPTAAITLQDDTSTNATFYPLFANNTTGFVSIEFTSSTKYQFNPFTGVLTATSFSGAGTGLTGTASSLSIGGNAATATSATTATNLAGGASGSVPYQTGSGATTMLSAGSNGQILTLASGVPTWAAAPATGITITDDTTTNATRYLTFTSATAGSITGENVSSTKLQYNPSTGTLTTTGVTTVSVQATNSAGLSLKNSAGTTQLSMGAGGGDNLSLNVSTNINGTNAQIDISPTGTGHVHIKPTGVNSIEIAPVSVGDMDNMIIGAITPAAGTFTALRFNTSLSANGSTGSSGQVLTSNGAGVPTWTTIASASVSVSDDTTTNAVRYPLFADATSGTISTVYASSTKYQFNPSTGVLKSVGVIVSSGLYENSATISVNYTIGTGNNAMSTGPITIDSGVSVTVPDNSNWVVL
jgi:hypothetical protein